MLVLWEERSPEKEELLEQAQEQGWEEEKEADQKKEEPTDDGPIEFSYCGKRGHLSKNCWSKLRNKETTEKAHVTQFEEDEPALFMVTASVLPDVPNPEEELPKSTEVIDDGITCSGERRTRGRVPIVHNKVTSWGANSTEGGASIGWGANSIKGGASVRSNQ